MIQVTGVKRSDVHSAKLSERKDLLAFSETYRLGGVILVEA